MIKIIFFVIIAVLCILGMAEVLHILKRRMLTSGSRPTIHLTVYLDDDTPDLQLAGVINEYNWSLRLRPDSIVGVYSCMTAEQMKACKRMADKYNITLYSLAEAKNKSIVQEDVYG